jgi:hypothetical protein
MSLYFAGWWLSLEMGAGVMLLISLASAMRMPRPAHAPAPRR